MVLVLTRKYITTCITKDLQLHQETTPYALTFLYTRYKPKNLRIGNSSLNYLDNLTENSYSTNSQLRRVDVKSNSIRRVL